MNNFILILYKILVILVISTPLCSCSNSENKNQVKEIFELSKKTNIGLVDSLGFIEINIPTKYDTSFSWIHYSDCGKMCNEQKYRFQPKSFPLIKETGSYWKEPIDSIDRFTISHSSFVPFKKMDTTIMFINHSFIINDLKSRINNPTILYDTIQKINGRYFSIVAIEKFDSIYTKKVVAVTTIKGNLVRFEYELFTKNKDSNTQSFVKESIKLVQTLKISKEM